MPEDGDPRLEYRGHHRCLYLTIPTWRALPRHGLTEPLSIRVWTPYVYADQVLKDGKLIGISSGRATVLLPRDDLPLLNRRGTQCHGNRGRRAVGEPRDPAKGDPREGLAFSLSERKPQPGHRCEQDPARHHNRMTIGALCIPQSCVGVVNWTRSGDGALKTIGLCLA